MSFQVIAPTDKFIDTDFYQWLLKQSLRNNPQNRFIDAIKEYTGQQQPFKGRLDGKAHRYVFDAFQRDLYKLKSIFPKNTSSIK